MLQTINAILVDDEVGCLDNLQHYLAAYCPNLHVAGSTSNIEHIPDLLKNLAIDIAFLDVHLFDRNIFDLLPSVWRVEIPIVFVTAYDSYALRAFGASAIDYLLKPLAADEVKRCYKKIEHYFEGNNTKNTSKEPGPDIKKTRKYVLKKGDHVYPVYPDEILMLKANGFYTEVFFEYEGKLKNVVISKPINQVHLELDSPLLLRVHRSYVVNLKRVTDIKKLGTSHSVEIGNNIVPIAKKRVDIFFDRYHA